MIKADILEENLQTKIGKQTYQEAREFQGKKIMSCKKKMLMILCSHVISKWSENITKYRNNFLDSHEIIYKYTDQCVKINLVS